MARRNFKCSAPTAGKLIDIRTRKSVEPPDLSIICERIRHYRKLAGIEQKALAQMIGITGNSVSNWENGRARPGRILPYS